MDFCIFGIVRPIQGFSTTKLCVLICNSVTFCIRKFLFKMQRLRALRLKMKYSIAFLLQYIVFVKHLNAQLSQINISTSKMKHIAVNACINSMRQQAFTVPPRTPRSRLIIQNWSERTEEQTFCGKSKKLHVLIIPQLKRLISPIFYKQILRHQILAAFCHTAQINIKVEHKFQLCVLVELGMVLLVNYMKLTLTPNIVHSRICGLDKNVGEIDPSSSERFQCSDWERTIGKRQPYHNSSSSSPTFSHEYTINKDAERNTCESARRKKITTCLFVCLSVFVCFLESFR